MTDRKEIFIRYLWGMFIIDLLSSIPFNVLAPNAKQIRVLNMLKIIRVLRIAKIINKMRIPEEKKAVSNYILVNRFLDNQNHTPVVHVGLLHASFCLYLVHHYIL